MGSKFLSILLRGNLIESKDKETTALLVRDCIQYIDDDPDFLKDSPRIRRTLCQRINWIIKSKYIRFLYTAKDWDSIETMMEDVFVRKRPRSKKTPAYLSVEINPLDEKKKKKKKRGLFLSNKATLELYKEWINKDGYDKLFKEVAESNESGKGRLWEKLPKDWDNFESDIEGVTYTKTPGSKNFPNGKIMLEINPIDAKKGAPLKKKGLFVADYELLEQFRENLKKKEIVELIEEIEKEINENEVLSKHIIESKYLAFLKAAKSWEYMETGIDGVIIKKMPKTKAMVAYLTVEVNPLDEHDKRKKKKGLYLDNLKELGLYREWFEKDGMKRTFKKMESINSNENDDHWNQFEKDWQRIPAVIEGVELEGVFFTKIPGTKKNPKGVFMVEISPIDPDTGKPLAGKGVFVRDYPLYKQMRTCLAHEKLPALIEEINK
jgi:hypothetical protein